MRHDSTSYYICLISAFRALRHAHLSTTWLIDRIRDAYLLRSIIHPARPMQRKALPPSSPRSLQDYSHLSAIRLGSLDGYKHKFQSQEVFRKL
jgi:hypothetical protein